MHDLPELRGLEVRLIGRKRVAGSRWREPHALRRRKAVAAGVVGAVIGYVAGPLGALAGAALGATLGYRPGTK